MVLVCHNCFGNIDSFDELDFDDAGNPFHSDCPHIVEFVEPED